MRWQTWRALRWNCIYLSLLISLRNNTETFVSMSLLCQMCDANNKYSFHSCVILLHKCKCNFQYLIMIEYSFELWTRIYHTQRTILQSLNVIFPDELRILSYQRPPYHFVRYEVSILIRFSEYWSQICIR